MGITEKVKKEKTESKKSEKEKKPSELELLKMDLVALKKELEETNVELEKKDNKILQMKRDMGEIVLTLPILSNSDSEKDKVRNIIENFIQVSLRNYKSEQATYSKRVETLNNKLDVMTAALDKQLSEYVEVYNTMVLKLLEMTNNIQLAERKLSENIKVHNSIVNKTRARIMD